MAEDQAELQTASEEDPGELWLKALKIFVVVTGIVLVMGTGAFVYLFLDKRESDRDAARERQVGPAAAIEAPDGARIRDVRLENGRALLVLEGTDGRSYLLYVDLTEGERLSLSVLD